MVYLSQSPVDNTIIGILAIILLVVMADKVVAKSIIVSRKLGISQMFIGLTIISIGTSFPEITTHLVASLDIVRGNIDPFIASSTVIGANIGSSMVQQTFITGLVGLLAILHGRTILIRKRLLKRDFLLVILAMVLLSLFSTDRMISRVEGTVLVVGYLVYLWFLWLEENKKIHAQKKVELDGKGKKGILLDLAYISAGLLAIVYSAETILRVAEFFVTRYQIGGSLIGVMTIGIASAMPELTTSVAAIIRKATSISIGTLVGSNITNPMFALGLGAMISSYAVPEPVIVYDLPVKIGTAIVIMVLLWKQGRLTRRESLLMMGMYLAYVLIRMKYFAVDV